MEQHLDKPVIITRIRVEVYRVPTPRPVATSFGVMTNRPAVFVRLEDNDGTFGWGEIFANWPAAGAEHRARLVIEDMSDLIIGQSVRHPSDLFHHLDKATHIRALQCGEWGPFRHAIAGLDIALHDLFARKAGLPIRKYLNPHTADSVQAYASGIHIKDAEAVINDARDQGFRGFKVKVGFDLKADIAAVLSLSPTLREGETLYSDANQGWDIENALTFVEETKDCALGWIEEPIPADASLQHWQRLASSSKIPLAGGENIAGFEPFDQAIQSKVFDFLQPDIAKWGGFTGCHHVAQRINEAGQTYCPHFLGGGIGLLASAHLLAATGGNGVLEVDVNPNPLRDALLQPKTLSTDSSWMLDSETGLGVTEIPEDLLQYQTLHLERNGHI